MADDDDILMENYVLGGIWVGVMRYVCEDCWPAELFTAMRNFGLGRQWKPWTPLGEVWITTLSASMYFIIVR